MKMKNRVLAIFAAAAVGLSGFAQTARQVLDQTSAKLKGSGGIEATFEATQFKGLKETGVATGKLQVQGSKFKITSDALTTWFDGKTQWTLLAGSDEVNVSKPTAAELQQINPYTFIDLYKQDYNLKLANFTYQGKACHEVRLEAQSSSAAFKLLIVVIDKQTRLPLSIRVKDGNGDWTRLRVSDIRTNRRWNDANFRFDEKKNPGIEVIDLR